MYGEHPAVAFVDLAAEVATEVRLIRAIEAELAVHAAERETAYRWADPGQLARTLPGLGEVGGPVLAAVIGAAARFPTGAHFKSYLGLTPRASETGDTDRKGQPMSKAGSRLLRSTLVRAADHARKQDPQLARIYYLQMVERGASHLKALCVVAGPPGRTRLGGDAPPHALRHLRHHRATRHPRTGQADHRRTVDRAR